MYSYTNGFRVSVRADGGEIVLQFVQRFPDFEENDAVSYTHLGISPRCSASSASTFRGHVLRGSSAAHVRPSRNSIRPFPSPYPATS